MCGGRASWLCIAGEGRRRRCVRRTRRAGVHIRGVLERVEMGGVDWSILCELDGRRVPIWGLVPREIQEIFSRAIATLDGQRPSHLRQTSVEANQGPCSVQTFFVFPSLNSISLAAGSRHPWMQSYPFKTRLTLYSTMSSLLPGSLTKWPAATNTPFSSPL
jgi:hypothetical protein